MPAPTRPTMASHLWLGFVGRVQLLGRALVQQWHQAREGAAAPAPQPIEVPYNPLYDLPALPPFRSADESLYTGTPVIWLSAPASTALEAIRQRLEPLLDVSQQRALTPEHLIEVCLLTSAADLHAHGADSQLVKRLGHQVTDPPARRERGEA